MIFYDTQCSFVKHSSYSQDPKALAEDQRGWHQKFTQLVKQPLSCADDASSLSCQQGCQSGPGTFLGPEEPGSQGLWHQAMFAKRLRKPIWRARARREPAHIRKGGSGAYKHSQNHGMDDVFAASEQTKIEDKDSEKTRTLYFTMFVACRAYAERRFGSPQTQPKPWYGRCITPHLVNFFGGVMSPPKYFFKIISKNQFPK